MRIKKTLLLKQCLGKCFCNKRTPAEMFFITVLKICQMYSFSIYSWNFKNTWKNLSIYPWLKAIFSKLLLYGCFPGNLPQCLRAAVPSESYTSRWLLWIELFCFITTLIFSCVQRNRGVIAVFFFKMECKGYSIFFRQEIILLTCVS